MFKQVISAKTKNLLALLGRQDFLKRGIKIASVENIAAMKLASVSSRGVKRDFIDLYFIVQNGISLLEIFQLYQKKYHNLTNMAPFLINSLTYFEDADKDVMPKMLVDCDWKQIKAYFKTTAPIVIDQLLALDTIH